MRIIWALPPPTGINLGTPSAQRLQWSWPRTPREAYKIKHT